MRYKYIFQSESDKRVKQWHFSRKNIFSFFVVAVVFTGAILFFSAEMVTNVIYKTKLKDISGEYTFIASRLIELQGKLNNLNRQITDIEQKDIAVRSYADMPMIDKDIRSLGIGGIALNTRNNNDLRPIAESKLFDIEMDVDELTRRVKLELTSYESIYDKVKHDAENLKYVPSIRPVLGGYLISDFGYRIDPIEKTRRFHYGLDFAVKNGTPVYAPGDGVIKRASYNGGFGKTVKIDHVNGYSTLFAHLSKISVKYNQEVRRGDIIGYSGSTGRTTGQHLHYEVHYYKTAQNPIDYFFSGYLK